ncbi:hypothetical protein [Streptomyces californicus]|uniref:hypothetical protein n=1 Tax=Streptomyces californicus TaxID=67351 RepID=UPI0036F786A6
MNAIVTAEQIIGLWKEPNLSAVIDRGDDFEPVTKDDLAVLIETDDEGRPLDDQWEIIADQLNSVVPGEPTSTAGHNVLAEIRDARIERDRVKKEADDEFNALIREAVVSKKTPVAAIADAAQMSRARIYQIRDGRR